MNMGVSKEQQSLWHQVQDDLGFNKNRTLFVDDSIPVLNAAREYGIEHLLAVANPDSQQPHNEIADYLSVTDYRKINITQITRVNFLGNELLDLGILILQNQHVLYQGF